MRVPIFLITLLVATFLTNIFIAAPSSQDREGETYIVQADDWLSKIAEELYGDILAYPAIVEATNTKAATDDSFSLIDNPDVIEIGQKLWIPAHVETAQTAIDPSPRIAGIYKAFTSAASSPGIDITIYLNVDQTFKQVLDYLEGTPPITQIGTWEVNETGQVVATITGQDNRDYDTPETLTLISGDERLSRPNGGGDITWVRLDALATTRQHLPYDPFTANLEIKERGFGGFGIYKAFAPSASCCGQDFTLTLNPTDNTAQLATNFHNDESAIIEVGTWQAEGDDHLTITLTGQKESAYDPPHIIRLALVDGLLTVVEADPAGPVSDGLAFYQTFAVHIAQALIGGGDDAISYYLQRPLGQLPNAVNLWAVELIKTRLQALLGEQYDRFILNMAVPGGISKEGSVFYVIGQGDEGQAIFLLDEANNRIGVKLLSDTGVADYTEGGQEILSLPPEVTANIANWQSNQGQ